MLSAKAAEEFTLSLLRHFGANCAVTHAYIPVSTMLMDNVQQPSKLLLTGYRFCIVRIPIEYVVVLRDARLAVLQLLDCGHGQDTRMVALVKQKVMHYQWEDRVEVVVIAGWSSPVCHCMFKIPPVFL